jgi:hypothetical protein
MDATNLPVMTTEAGKVHVLLASWRGFSFHRVVRRSPDAIQVRPAEVLFETWAAFRQQGVQTPSISIWQTCPPGGTLWQNALNLYNTYPDLVYKDPVSGKKVFFTPSDNQDASILSRTLACDAVCASVCVRVCDSWLGCVCRGGVERRAK